MSDTNSQVKSLLLDAQLIVTNKFTVFSADSTVDKTKLGALQKKADEQIEQFKQPQVWLQQVVINHNDVFSCLLAINKVDVPKIDDLTTQVDALISILGTALTSANNSSVRTFSNTTNQPNRNQEALAVLGHIDGVMMDVMLMFMDKNIDLAGNNAYQAIIQKQDPLLKDYRKKLRDEKVMADEIDVMLLNGFAQNFQAVKEVNPYLKQLGEYNDFIKRGAAIA